MERIDKDTWRTDNGDEVRAQGLRVTVEFGEKTKAEVLCAVEAVRAENASLRGAVKGLGDLCDKYKEENAKLRMCLGDGCADCAVGMGEYADSLCDPLKAENEKLKKRLAQYELFSEVVGDPAHEFASLRRELHRVERENAKLSELCDKCKAENADLRERISQLDYERIMMFLGLVGEWINVKQREMEDGQ